MTFELADQLNHTETHFWRIVLDEFADPIHELREIKNDMICESNNIFDHKSTIRMNKDTLEIMAHNPRVQQCYQMANYTSNNPPISVYYLDHFNRMMAAVGLPKVVIDMEVPTGWFQWIGLRWGS